MIESLAVDGFKSLSNLVLTIRPGLNILVGPNGSGKTNVISLLEFLSDLVRRGVADAVSLAGGAGSIFRKIGENAYQDSISCEVSGTIGSVFGRGRRVPRVLRYRYAFTMTVSSERDRIYFSYQSLKLAERKKLENWREGDWDLDVEFKERSPENNRVEVKHYNPKNIRSRWSARTTRTLERHLIPPFISADLSDACLVGVLRFQFEEADKIVSDFSGAHAFNIVPARVKISEDSTRPPGIQKDGSGLAPTLYAIKLASQREKDLYRSNFSRRHYGLRISENTFDQIQQYLKIANPSIESLNVYNRPFDNQLNIVVHLMSSSGVIALPFSAMSDGTIKWLSLVTALLTYRAIFAIEEPENYIHPLMQQEIVRIIRDTSSNREEKSFVMMTTHSETMLNAADPDEVIVVRMEDGLTAVSRVANKDQLAAEIRRSGFGLGYYYVTGALENA